MNHITAMKQALDALAMSHPSRGSYISDESFSKKCLDHSNAMQALQDAIERPANVPTQKQSFPERCNSQAEQLDQLADEFEQLGWHGHATQITYTAGHLRIYAHQLDAKEKGDRS